MESWEPIEIAQDPRKHRVPGRRLRAGITRMILLSEDDRIGFLRNAVRSRQTEKRGFSKCIEPYACEFTAAESGGALRNASYLVRFC